MRSAIKRLALLGFIVFFTTFAVASTLVVDVVECQLTIEFEPLTGLYLVTGCTSTTCSETAAAQGFPNEIWPCEEGSGGPGGRLIFCHCKRHQGWPQYVAPICSATFDTVAFEYVCEDYGCEVGTKECAEFIGEVWSNGLLWYHGQDCICDEPKGRLTGAHR